MFSGPSWMNMKTISRSIILLPLYILPLPLLSSSYEEGKKDMVTLFMVKDSIFPAGLCVQWFCFLDKPGHGCIYLSHKVQPYHQHELGILVNISNTNTNSVINS
jgi:hypothetical protein